MFRVQSSAESPPEGVTNGVHPKKTTEVGSGKTLKWKPASADSRIVEIKNRRKLTAAEQRVIHEIVLGLSDRRESSLRSSLLGLLKEFDRRKVSEGALDECRKLVGETLSLGALYGRGAIKPLAK